MISAIIGALVAVILSVLGLGVVASAADHIDISIADTLSPTEVTVSVGTTVTWTNNDSQEHELRSTSGPQEFRTDTLKAGQNATLTFTTPGTYAYGDHRTGSPAYNGTIVVTDAGTPVTPPAGGGTTPPVTPPPAPLTATVHLAGARFSPATITVGLGATVTWLNDDGAKHTVTADNASFDSGTLNAGANFVTSFTTLGSFTYVCNFHGNMSGTVNVTGASGGPTPPPATVPPTTQPPVPTPPPAVNPPAPGAAAAPGAPAGPTNVSVGIANNLFSPATVTVNAGSTVTWSNSDTVTHTATADDGSFSSGLVKKATSWAHTFATPGTFTYFCEIHPEMTGTVIAIAPNGTAPPAAPAAAAATGSISATGTTGGTTSTGSAGAASGSITISDSGFTPASFRVAVGGTVTFANNGKAMHTVTAGNGSFDSDMIKSGGTWAHTFTTAGSFAYSCILHPNMRGTINVGSSASGGGSAGLATEAATAGPASGTTAQADAASPAGTSTDPAILPVNVDVADNEFRPNPATVATGGTVTWKLVGAAAHTVTADDQSFNSGLLKPGETFQHTFNTLGSFTYTCLVHPGMVGTIEVVPPAQAAEQQAAPVSGDGPQAQPPAAAPATIAATDPPGDSGIWGQTLLGIAAVLTACCALVFALKSFLKVLGSPEPEGQVAASSDGLTPHAV
jgi:plastocyanin